MILLEDKLLEELVRTWGKEAQIKMAIEEMGELITVLMRIDRGRVETGDVTTEIADVGLMIQQLRYIFGKEQVDLDTNYKINRVKERLQKYARRDT